MLLDREGETPPLFGGDLMLTLVVDLVCDGGTRVYFENLTVKEFGEKIVDLSKKYILVYDGCITRHEGMYCDMYVCAVDFRSGANG